MPIIATLCLIIKDGKILLQKKSAGRFGEFKWNAPGGRLRPGETIEECSIREVFEETGLRVKNLKKCGILNFFSGNKDKPAWIVHVFLIDSFEGRIKEADEGILKWFELDNLPFDEMWGDDKYWYPYLLDGKNFKGNFYFSENFKQLIEYDVEELS